MLAEIPGAEQAGVTRTYDARGRLTDVTRDGAAWRHYAYDVNGNRTGVTEGATSSITADYDGQDRILSYGSAMFEHNAMGQRTSKIDGADTTAYDYDELGNLTSVGLPDKTVSYVVDGLNRRVARKVDGTLTNRYLYGGGILPLTELNQDGSVKARFVYASKGHVPDYMIRNGTTYRFVTDQVGSVRLVVNTADGAIAQRIDYDPFGKVLSDTNPGFQPFGFAGGLYDADTGLVRFGARDYDADTGRWTAKDPILFAGGDSNLYAYVGSDPTNGIDPRGLFCVLGHNPNGSCRGSGSAVYNWDGWYDINDSVGGVTDGLTHIPFTETSLTGELRDHMVEGGIAVDVNKCSWGYNYARRIGGWSQKGLFLIGGAGMGARAMASKHFGWNSRLFGRHGWMLNKGPVRIWRGWKGSAKGGHEVFRIGLGGPGKAIHWHIDILW